MITPQPTRVVDPKEKEEEEEEETTHSSQAIAELGCSGRVSRSLICYRKDSEANVMVTDTNVDDSFIICRCDKVYRQ